MIFRQDVRRVLLATLLVFGLASAAQAACPASTSGMYVRLRQVSTGSLVTCVNPSTEYKVEVYGPSENVAYCISNPNGTAAAPLATLGFTPSYTGGAYCADATYGDIAYPYGFRITTDSDLPSFGIVGAVSPTCSSVSGSYEYLEELAFSYNRCTTGGSTCLEPPADMVAWYSFDETSGSTAADLALSNDATRVGATWTASGKVSRALDFDGVDDRAEASSDPTLNFGTGDFSIDAWIRTTDSNGVIASKRATINAKYVGYLFMVYNGRLLLQIGDTVNSWRNYADLAGTRVDDGTWRHVAVTVDRDNPFGGRMFVNGQLIYTFDPTSRAGDTSNSAKLEMGRANGGGSYLDATLDEVEIFERTLSGAEVLAMYKAGSGGKCKAGQTDPLQVYMLCGNPNPDVFCGTNTVGGASPYTHSWSYSGNGFLSASGSTATIYGCSGSNNQVTVTATDAVGSQASVSRTLNCN